MAKTRIRLDRLGMTAEELFAPFTLTCGKCGGAATAYPDGVFCPKCSPAWVGSFLVHLQRGIVNGERQARAKAHTIAAQAALDAAG